jgi:hypothetical protein
MVENKQTAVEWLESKLNSVKPTDFCSIETIKDWVKQAKQMEEQQTGDWVETHWYEEIGGKNYKLYYDKNNEWK